MKGKSICFLVTKPKEIYNRTVWKEDLKSVQGDLQISFISYTFTKGIKKKSKFFILERRKFREAIMRVFQKFTKRLT